MDRISPIGIWLEATPSEPEISLGDMVSQVWELVYLDGPGAWELRYSYGLVVYRMSRAWFASGPNVFDVITHDGTSGAPPSVTLWPFSPVPCECPGSLSPEPVELVLTPAAPSIREAMLIPVQEIPAGVVDGVNLVFTLAQVPATGASVLVWENGVKLTQGVQYTVAGAVITFAGGLAPPVGTEVSAYYWVVV